MKILIDLVVVIMLIMLACTSGDNECGGDDNGLGGVGLVAKWVGFTLAYLGLKPGLEAQPASPTLPLHCTLQFTPLHSNTTPQHVLQCYTTLHCNAWPLQCRTFMHNSALQRCTNWTGLQYCSITCILLPCNTLLH